MRSPLAPSALIHGLPAWLKVNEGCTFYPSPCQALPYFKTIKDLRLYRTGLDLPGPVWETGNTLASFMKTAVFEMVCRSSS